MVNSNVGCLTMTSPHYYSPRLDCETGLMDNSRRQIEEGARLLQEPPSISPLEHEFFPGMPVPSNGSHTQLALWGSGLDHGQQLTVGNVRQHEVTPGAVYPHSVAAVGMTEVRQPMHSAPTDANHVSLGVSQQQHAGSEHANAAWANINMIKESPLQDDQALSSAEVSSNTALSAASCDTGLTPAPLQNSNGEATCSDDRSPGIQLGSQEYAGNSVSYSPPSQGNNNGPGPQHLMAWEEEEVPQQAVPAQKSQPDVDVGDEEVLPRTRRAGRRSTSGRPGRPRTSKVSPELTETTTKAASSTSSRAKNKRKHSKPKRSLQPEEEGEDEDNDVFAPFQCRGCKKRFSLIGRLVVHVNEKRCLTAGKETQEPTETKSKASRSGRRGKRSEDPPPSDDLGGRDLHRDSGTHANTELPEESTRCEATDSSTSHQVPDPDTERRVPDSSIHGIGHQLPDPGISTMPIGVEENGVATEKTGVISEGEENTVTTVKEEPAADWNDDNHDDDDDDGDPVDRDYNHDNQQTKVRKHRGRKRGRKSKGKTGRPKRGKRSAKSVKSEEEDAPLPEILTLQKYDELAASEGSKKARSSRSWRRKGAGGAQSKLPAAEKQLREHIETAHADLLDLQGELFDCKICEGKSYSTAYSLMVHLRMHKDAKSFACPKCDQVFSHPHIDRPHCCDKCGARYKHARDLKLHEMSHTGEKPFQCEFCPAAYTRNKSLMEHIRRHTGERPFPCTHCDMRFRQKCDLRQHLRVHTGERPYECDTCHKRFKQRANLRAHVRIHSGERPFPCPICGKLFTRSTVLKQHTRIHTNEKPYSCLKCSATFRQLSKLRVHMFYHHSEEKPHQCPECDAAFRFEEHLELHSKLHRGICPYEDYEGE